MQMKNTQRKSGKIETLKISASADFRTARTAKQNCGRNVYWCRYKSRGGSQGVKIVSEMSTEVDLIQNQILKNIEVAGEMSTSVDLMTDMHVETVSGMSTETY